MSLHIDRRIWQALFWLCWMLCTAMFLLPAAELPAIDIWDKAVHAGIFALLMSLVLPAYWQVARLAMLVLSLVLYGIGIECVQSVIPGRGFSLLDVVADASGIFPVALAATIWKRA